MFGWKKEKLRELEDKIASLNTKFLQLETQMHSLRGTINRKLGGRSSNVDVAEESGSSGPTEKDIEEIRRAFGGDLPIEFTQKYKNSN